jgi:hypothetical protein
MNELKKISLILKLMIFENLFHNEDVDINLLFIKIQDYLLFLLDC